jgi:hypothetical protein
MNLSDDLPPLNQQGSVNNTQLEIMKAQIAADPGARFAISLDGLAYAKDNHRLNSALPVSAYAPVGLV